MKYVAAVTFYRHEYLGPAIAMFLLVLMCYLAGRIHQFFKQTIEREQAYRDGYNTATKSLFSLATRAAKGVSQLSLRPEPKPMRGFASVETENRSPLPAKHRAGGRRRSNIGDTKRLTPDWPVLDRNQ